jgi:toxin ParE1/3/4
MLVEYSLDVEGDLDEIASYIAADNPRRASSFIQEIRSEIQRIGEGPHLYQLRQEVGADARIGVVGRYVILFWIDGDVVRIERVVHGNRLLPLLFQ